MDKIELILCTSHTLSTLANEPNPRNLDESQVKEMKKYSAWLHKASEELESFASHWAQETRSFTLKYLQLQNKISHENREFSTVSNIMKNKHDTAKNSINNIR